MINCYVIGSISTVETVSEFLHRLPDAELKGYALKQPDDFKMLFESKPELVFVEVEVLTRKGKWLEGLIPYCSVVIISSNIGYAYDAFESQAFDYLLKPVLFDRFVKSFHKYGHFKQLFSFSDSIRTIKDSFFIKTETNGTKEILIKCDQLLYIQALQNYVVLHMQDGNCHYCYNSLKEMEDSLPSQDFIRIHRSYIINESKITSIEGNAVILNSDVKNKILLGNSYKKAFLEKKDRMVIKKSKYLLKVLKYPKLGSSMILFMNFLLFRVYIIFLIY